MWGEGSAYVHVGSPAKTMVGQVVFLFGGGTSGRTMQGRWWMRAHWVGAQEGGGDTAYGFGVRGALIKHHTAVVLKRRATFAVAHNSPLRGEEGFSTQW